VGAAVRPRCGVYYANHCFQLIDNATHKGQSFLLHQIRKMVSLAVEVVRGSANKTTVLDAFTTRRMELPMAPSLGLYLGLGMSRGDATD
jgi:tRNA pseudouridine38-40 synthase